MLSVRCPAKINTVLLVRGLRADGYHELDTEFVSLALHDTLAMEPSRGFSLEVVGAPPDRVPVADNLVLRAAAALQREVGETALPGARLRLVKRIPAAGGLGGGSSDAAGALLGLARLHGLEVPFERLAELALELGSDVPYFLRAGRQRGRSRGEALEELPDRPDRPVLLVNPGLPLPTGQVFRAWDEQHPAERPTLTSRKMSPNFLPDSWWKASEPLLHNDLWEPACRVLPQLVEVERSVRDRLPAWRIGLSGSGPTLFALPDAGVRGPEDEAAAAADSLRGKGWLFLLTRTLGRAEHEATRYAD